jgi:nanoRNase/pAp phosphatase (c-di-AMP/oligoRNAs hydrolase)
MSLEKQISVHQIQIVNNRVEVSTSVRIIENGQVISSTMTGKVIAPGDDYSSEDAQVQSICAAVHTAEVIAAYQEVAQPV